MNKLSCEPPKPATKAPLVVLPENACDCHFHVFDELSTLVADRVYTPPRCTFSDYHQMSSVLGLERGVVIQPSVYGTDNRSTLAVVAKNPDKFRAIVVVENTVSEAELEQFHQQGVRGIRINVSFGASYNKEQLIKLAHRIQPLGWHIQLLVDVSDFDYIFEDLASIPVPLVIDHMGHVHASKGVTNAGFQQLLRSVAEGKAWVKLSGTYRNSSNNSAPYVDTSPFARELLKANTERCLWGTDWPHPGLNENMPDDTELLDATLSWITNEESRLKVFVDNPEQLYDFPRTAR